MKKTKFTVQVEFDEGITQDQSDEVALRLAKAILSQINHSEEGIAPEDTYTEFVKVSNETIAYDIDPKNNSIELGHL